MAGQSGAGQAERESAELANSATASSIRSNSARSNPARSNPAKASSALRAGWLGAIAALLLILQIALVAIRPDFYQYDFRAYYLGPKLFLAGRNPYDEAALIEAATELGLATNNHPFLYAPHMLVAFLPLAWLSYEVAYYAWLALQCAALVVVFHVASKRLAVDRTWLALALAFGANGAIAACLRSGQIALVTTALATMGAAILVDAPLRAHLSARRAPFFFAASLFLASIPKLWPAPLLGLTAIDRASFRSRVASAALGFFFLGAVLVADVLLAPRAWAEFRHAAGQLSGLAAGTLAGPVNGSSLNFLRALATAWQLPGDLALVVYGAFVATVGLFTIRAIGVGLRDRHAKRLDLVWIATMGLFLVLPRVLTYEWCFVLPALAASLPRIEDARLRAVAVFCFFVPSLYVNRYVFGLEPETPVASTPWVLWSFVSLFSLALTWSVAVRRVLEARGFARARASRGLPVPAT